MMPGANRSTGIRLRGRNWPFIVNGRSQRVDHAADQAFTHRHAQNLAGALDLIAFAKLGVITQNHRTDLILFQTQSQPANAVRERKQFARHHLVEPVQARDTVAKRSDCANFVYLDLGVVVRDLLAK